MAFKVSFVAAILALSVLFNGEVDADGHAHSFQHFHGPVIGDAQEVTWKDKHGHHHHDYVAHPHYEFSYGVEDHHTGDYHGQKEHRDGKEVVGEYTIKEPGGNVRTVKYRAGKDGFFAHVINSNGNDHDGGHRH
ncbi:cuticle protein 7-like [Frieseomelitta varia]|uniref:cuticle protein 7-like n=1 Tax=Frieseomelitta varia TaxID=561572 RepID=UPI001CB69598|nr:cuticle protein 7-like [Frieseomelitta varia]